MVAQTYISAKDSLLAIAAARSASVETRQGTAILAAKLILVPALRRAHCQSAFSIRLKASMCAPQFPRILHVAESKASHAKEVRLELAVAYKGSAVVLATTVHKAGKSMKGSGSTATNFLQSK